LAEFDNNLCVTPGRYSITANYFEVGLVDISEDQGRHMSGFDRVGDGFFDERPRWFDLTELPLCVGEGALTAALVSGPKRNLALRSRSGS
jgi:hypothetical protein